MLRYLFCLLIALDCSIALGAEVSFSYNGCVTASGQTVAAYADPALQHIAKASVKGSTPVIRYNPEIAPELRQDARLFLFARECARIYLQQPLNQQRPTKAVHRADCLALEMLRQSDVINGNTDVAEIETALAANSGIWQPGHGLKLASCPATYPPLGTGIALPRGVDAVHSDQWNRCVQRCGDTLYQCGNTSACQKSYETCAAQCGQ